MDFNLKQWKEQHESEQQTLVFHSNPHSESQALPLFATEPPTSTSKLIAATPPDSVSKYASPGMGGGNFSLAQWQELELQALIFRHMLSGAAVPPQLLHLVKKSLFTNSAHPYYSFPPPSMQSGYWGRAAMDPEPGRCRRTDGKKWRCSRDAVGAGKYCERHMHRGRNRSRKPVENSAAAAGGGGMVGAASSSAVVGGGGGGAGSQFGFSRGLSPSVDKLQLNQRSSETPMVERQNDDEAKNGQVLRHFFDDWPRPPPQQNESTSTNLSISISGSNPTSDFSLKLSTGDEAAVDRNHSSWPAQWSSGHVSSNSMGGPLAEALQSSTSTASPTSVLHQLQRGCSASELTS